MQEPTPTPELEPQATPAPKKTAPWYARFSFWVKTCLLVLVGLPLLLVVGVFFALQTSLVEKHVWPRVQPVIAETTGFDVNLSSVRLNLLNSFYLKDVQVSQAPNAAAPNCSGFILTLDEVQIKFSTLALIGKHLEVSELSLNNLNAQGCLVVDLDASSQAEITAEPAAPADLAQLLNQVNQLLDAPPLSLNIEKIALHNFNVDVQIGEVQQRLNASWQGQFNLVGNAQWQEQGINAYLTTQLNSTQPLSVNFQPTPEEQLSLFTEPNFNLDLTAQVKQQADHWQLELTPVTANFSLQPLKFSQKNAANSLQAELAAYQLNFNSRVSLSAQENFDPQVEVAVRQQLTDLKLNLDGEEYSWQELNFDLNSHNQNSEVFSQINIAVQQLASSFSHAPINVQQKLHSQFNLDLSQVYLSAATELNAIQLAKFTLNLSNLPQNLAITPQLNLYVPQHLASIFTEPALQELPGDLQLELSGLSSFKHTAKDLLKADFSQIEGQFNQALNLSISQQKPTTELVLAQPVQVSFNLATPWPQPAPELNLQVHSAGVQHPPLLKPLPIKFNLAAQANSALTQLTSSMQLELAQQKLMQLEIQANDTPQQLELTSWLEAHLSPSLKAYVAELAELEQLGKLDVHQQLQVQLKHPYANLMELANSNLDLNQLQAQVKQQLKVEQQPSQQALVILQQPLIAEHNLNWNAAQAKLDAKYQLAAVSVPETLSAQNLSFNLQAQATNGLNPESFSWEIATQAEKLSFIDSGKTIELSQLLPFSSTGAASFNNASQVFTLNSLVLEMGDWFKQQLSGEAQLANLEQPSFEFEGHSHLNPEHLSIPDVNFSSSGSINLPWRLVMHQGQNLSLNAQVEFDNFSVQLDEPQLKLEQLHGSLSVQEEFQLNPDGKLQFQYLLSPDAFQRVDFNQIEPYLSSQEGLSFKSLEFDQITAGPLAAKFKIAQNLIELPQFSLKMLEGDLAGQFYLDINPQGWRLGLLSRISHLDLRKLLPRAVTSDYAPVSARTAVEFDFNQRLLEGRIDLTDISRSQLLQLLEIVDPEFTDADINTVRSALRLAHPQQLSIIMSNGLMDLSLQLSLFKDPLLIHGLPLSSIIERFGEEALLIPDQLPLE